MYITFLAGVADALSNTLPNVLGTNQQIDSKGTPSATQDAATQGSATSSGAVVRSQSASGSGSFILFLGHIKIIKCIKNNSCQKTIRS